jgi:hypothetical protein
MVLECGAATRSNLPMTYGFVDAPRASHGWLAAAPATLTFEADLIGIQFVPAAILQALQAHLRGQTGT